MSHLILIQSCHSLSQAGELPRVLGQPDLSLVLLNSFVPLLVFLSNVQRISLLQLNHSLGVQIEHSLIFSIYCVKLVP